MSYDTSILIDTGGEHPATVEDIGNMTRNVGAMYRAVLPGPYPGGGLYDGTLEIDRPPTGGITALSGLPASEVAEHLEGAVARFVEQEEELRKLEPSNGWGTYEGALSYLRDCLEACRRHPLGTFAINW